MKKMNIDINGERMNYVDGIGRDLKRMDEIKWDRGVSTSNWQGLPRSTLGQKMASFLMNNLQN